MKKTSETYSGKTKRYRKHPIGGRLVVGLLCVCMTTVSLPVEHFGILVQAAQKQEVVSAPELSQEIREQTVPVGTELQELDLPETLTASCRLLEDEPQEQPQETVEPKAEPKIAEPQSAQVSDAMSPAGTDKGLSDQAQPTVSDTEQASAKEDAESSSSEKAAEPAPSEEGTEPAPSEEETESSGEPSEPAPPEGGTQPALPEETPMPDAEPEEKPVETVVIDGVTWNSEPAYDKDTQGLYDFSPVLPDNYCLAGGVELPVIHVLVVPDGGKKDIEREQKGRFARMTEAKGSELLLEDEPAEDETPTVPGCGRVSRDVTWESAGILQDGELIVDPGVTLTIKGALTIQGNVAIKGGGKIVRGSGNAMFTMASGGSLTLEDILIDGASISSANSMISVDYKTSLTMNAGSKIQNCTYSSGSGAAINTVGTTVINGGEIDNCMTDVGGAIAVQSGNLTIEYAVIENCTATSLGGGIYIRPATLVIKDGIFRNNKTTSSDVANWTGGGFLCQCSSKVTIYGGQFIGNTTAAHGGAIYHCGCGGTTTDIRGGYFEGNTCTHEKYKGSGAIYNSSQYQGNTSLTLSGKLHFVGDGSTESGMDGVYLDKKSGSAYLRKIYISDTLSYPVNLYLEAEEGRVIAEGVNEYRLLHERDMKKINFVDTGDSGKTWYAVLNEDTNEVYVSETNPNYAYYVYYISNGAEGTVVDDGRYEINDDVMVKSDDELHKDGHVFKEWNTDPDGINGTSYQPGEEFKIQGDTDLYAIFREVSVFKGSFYSGSAGNAESIDADMSEDWKSGTLTTPQLAAMDGFTPIGWNTSPDAYDGEVEAGDEVTLTGDTSYYGVYEKEVTLSYDANGGETCPPSETKICRANVHEEVSHDVPEFGVADAVERTGYVFAGWNTKQDGTGEPFDVGKDYPLSEDTTLYAVWVAGDGTPYRVEHYKQNLEGDEYTREDADTEYIGGKTGSVVTAEVNPYTGFAQSENPAIGKPAGIVAADGSLVLQVYYDRNVYEVDFDLNGGEGTAPGRQAVRYGGLLQEPEEPQRRGYTFKGWYKDAEGSEESYWDFGKTVEGNTDLQKITLYAKWADETAPVFGEASFGTDYKNLMDWVVSQKKLIISVPITEEGSGLKQADYRMEPEKGEAREGTAAIRRSQVPTQEVKARSGGIAAVMTLRGDAQSGQSIAEITVDGDFKGSISLTSMDNAGNVSVQKVLTADGAGAVVEDNAPEISFTSVKADKTKEKAKVGVDVTDTAGENVTAGLASVSYRIDGGKMKVQEEEFANDMVENYSFDVEIKGEGEHTLKVVAEDNAGNRSEKKTTVKITKKKAVIVQKKQTPTASELPKAAGAAGEPKTGDHTFVKIFATLGMIAGFTYLLLYFTSGESGITEREKEEIISRLICWAQKGKLRKYPALLMISLFLLYYHSIGKSVDVEWKKVYEG